MKNKAAARAGCGAVRKPSDRQLRGGRGPLGSEQEEDGQEAGMWGLTHSGVGASGVLKWREDSMREGPREGKGCAPRAEETEAGLFVSLNTMCRSCCFRNTLATGCRQTRVGT